MELATLERPPSPPRADGGPLARRCQERKGLTHLRATLAAGTPGVAWRRVESELPIDTPAGKKSLADLFDGRCNSPSTTSMFGSRRGEGCPSCSMARRRIRRLYVHIAQSDGSFAAIFPRALTKIEAFKQAHGLALFVGLFARHQLQPRDFKVFKGTGS